MAALWEFESQIESLWSTGGFEEIRPVPTDAEEKEIYKTNFEKRIQGRDENVANKFREKLVELYGESKGNKIAFAEAFELCEYGKKPSMEELKKIFLLE